jgi:hypothetical protein
MDFDIGNLLYVVITLVAVIIGLLGRKKKPAGTGTGSGEGSQGGSFVENLERAFNMGQEEQVVVDLAEEEPDIPVEESDYEPVNTTERAMEAPSMMNEYQQYLEQTDDPSRDNILTKEDEVTEPLEVIHLEDDQGTDYFEVIKDFDAGTAVVYSAIINRVDY